MSNKPIYRSSKRKSQQVSVGPTREEGPKAQLPPHKYATYRKCFIVIRHAETCSDVFPEWVDLCFDGEENYTQINLNFPRFLIKRNDVHEYIHDPPITQLGWTMAGCIVESLILSSLTTTCFYCSPSFKCIQTAQAMAGKLAKRKIKARIRVEPALAEFIGYNENPIARFFEVSTLKSCSYDIDVSYQPTEDLDNIQYIKSEKKEGFYRRIAKTFDLIKEQTKNDVRVILVVPPTVMDAIVKAAKNKGPDMVSDNQLKYRMKDSYPPLSSIFLAQNATEIKNKTFSIVLRPIPKMTVFGHANKVDLEYLKASTDFESKEEYKSEEASEKRNNMRQRAISQTDTSVAEATTDAQFARTKKFSTVPKLFDDKYREEGSVFGKKKMPFKVKKLGKSTRPAQYRIDEQQKSKETVDNDPAQDSIVPLPPEALEEEEEKSKRHNYTDQIRTRTKK